MLDMVWLVVGEIYTAARLEMFRSKTKNQPCKMKRAIKPFYLKLSVGLSPISWRAGRKMNISNYEVH